MLHLVQQLVPFPLILVPNRMAWLWPGRGTVEPQWSNCSDAFLAIQNWTGQLGVANGIWQCLRLANQRQSRGQTRAEFSMAARCEWPGHPDSEGPAPRASVPGPSAVSGCYVEASAAPLSTRTVPSSEGSLEPGLPRLRQGILTRGVKAVRILPTTIEA